MKQIRVIFRVLYIKKMLWLYELISHLDAVIGCLL